MSLLRRLTLGLSALFTWGCGARTYCEHALLDPVQIDGSILTIYLGVESGSRSVSGQSFNPTGQRTTTRVDAADLYRLDFRLDGDAAAFASAQHLMHVPGRPLVTAITATEGMLRQSPPPALVDGEAVHLASDGQRLCVRLRDRFTVFGDAARGRQLDAGTVPTLANLQFTWAGDRLYAIETDAAGGTSRVHHTRVGSGGAWESLTYDPASMPVDAEPGQTWVEAYDMVDGEAVLLVRKSYAQGAGAARSRGPTYAILRGPRLVASWSGDPPGRIRPALRSIVGWHRSLGSLRAVLTLRSLDDGSVRRIAVDAGGALRAIAPPTGR